MPPSVCWTAAATPALPRWPEPAGQFTATPLPSADCHAGLTLERESVRLYVVPELSERWMIATLVLGRLTPLFSFWIAGSFQDVIWPMKIFASVGPSILIRFLTPGRL